MKDLINAMKEEELYIADRKNGISTSLLERLTVYGYDNLTEYFNEKRFKEYWLKYKYLHDSISQDAKAQIIMGIKNRMYAEGMVLETLTFNEWIKQVEEMK